MPTTASTASTAGTGASRYARFPKPPPTAQTPGSKMGPDAKANVFNAWQNMNHGHGPRPQSHHAGQPPSPYPSAKPASDQEQAFRKSASATAWEHLNNPSQPGATRNQPPRTPRKTGFDPTTPGADEPAATGTSAYYTTSRYERVRQPPPPPPPTGSSSAHANVPFPPPSGHAHMADRLDPLSQFKARTCEDVPFSEGNPRMRAPYYSGAGEKTYVSGDNLRRSSSTRDNTRMSNSPEYDHMHGERHRGSSARHRSASPTHRKTYDPRAVPSPAAAPSTPQTGHNTPKLSRSKTSRNTGRPFVLYSSNSEESEDDPHYRSRHGHGHSHKTHPTDNPKQTPSKQESQTRPHYPNRPKAQPSTSWTRKREEQAARSRPENGESGSTGFDNVMPDRAGQAGSPTRYVAITTSYT